MTLEQIKQLIDSGEEIRTLAIDPTFGTYTFDALKHMANELLLTEKELSPFLIMADVNDLYQWNIIYKKEGVNVLIRKIIKKLNQIVSGKENIIAKRGDELYIFLPNSSKAEIEEIKEKIKGISVSKITVSVGASEEIEGNDIETPIDDSEKEMMKDKKEHKKEVLFKTYGENINDILKYLIDNRLARSRFDLEKMTVEQVNEFKKNVLEAIRHVENGISISTVRDNRNIEKEREDYITRQNNQIIEYKKESSQKNGQINNAYVMKQVLKNDAEKECLRERYFQEISLPEARKEDYEGNDIVLIKFSGTKIVNNRYGHTICDSRIREKIRKIKDECSNSGIRRISPIIIRGAKEAYFFVEPSEKLSAFADKINSSNDEKSEIIVHVSNLRIPEISEKATTKELVNGTLMKLREREENSQYDYKIKNQQHLIHMIKALVNAMKENSIIQQKIEENPTIEGKIIRYMKTYFNLLILKRKEKNPRTPRSTIKRNHIEH